jgi:hypothetical protein
MKHEDRHDLRFVNSFRLSSKELIKFRINKHHFCWIRTRDPSKWRLQMTFRPRDNWGPVYEDCTVTGHLKATKLDICVCRNACLVNKSITRQMPYLYHATL